MSAVMSSFVTYYKKIERVDFIYLLCTAKAYMVDLRDAVHESVYRIGQVGIRRRGSTAVYSQDGQLSSDELKYTSINRHDVILCHRLRIKEL